MCTFAVCFPLFTLAERAASRPIMPLGLIASAPRANLILANFVGAILTNAIMFNLPLFFQAVLLSSATDSGLWLMIPSGVAACFGVAVGFLITRTRRLRWPVVGGCASLLVGCACLAVFLRRDLIGVQPGSDDDVGTLLGGFFSVATTKAAVVGNAALLAAIMLPSAVGQGLQFPGTFVAVLAASPRRQQAVAGSTLSLWRSIGSVVGVAGSSLVVQNALRTFLERDVVVPVADDPDGAKKREIIRAVRSSVEAVAALPEPYRAQVQQSYETALRVVFGVCVLLAALSLALVLPIKLPRLGERKPEEDEQETPQVVGGLREASGGAVVEEEAGTGERTAERR